MKHKTQHNQPFNCTKTPAQLYQNRKDRQSDIRSDKKHGVINNMREWLRDRDYEDAHPKPLKINTNLKVVHNLRTAPRRKRGRGEGTRSSISSGDGNSSDSDPDPERRTPASLQLYDQAALASLFKISKKSVQNQYSVAPHTFPPAIQIPGARGPRWTPAAVQAWLSERPAHTSTPAPAPAPARKKAGRPRIALAIKGVRP